MRDTFTLSQWALLAIFMCFVGVNLQTKASEPSQENSDETLVVCELMQAKHNPQNLCEGAIAFSAPRGDGHSGANGVLLNAGCQWSELGTRWQFEYIWSNTAKGFQIIHPWQDGHIVVTYQGEVRLSSPGAWSKIGYRGTGDIEITHTPLGHEALPLQESQDYVITSNLAPDGAYQLLIDGELAITARITQARPLDLTIPEGVRPPMTSARGELSFQGEGLPDVLRRGDAALILGPMDRGSNIARNVRLQSAESTE